MGLNLDLLRIFVFGHFNGIHWFRGVEREGEGEGEGEGGCY